MYYTYLMCSIYFLHFFRGTLEDGRQKGSLPRLLKTSGFKKLEPSRPQSDALGRLQAKDIRQYRSEGESLLSMAPEESMITRPSQSAPL